MGMTCMLPVLYRFSKKEKASIILPQGVYEESVIRPLRIKRFELNAVKIRECVRAGWMTVANLDREAKALTEEILHIANGIFSIGGKPLTIVHRGEAEMLAMVKQVNAKAILIDERNTRLIVEEPNKMKGHLQRRMQKNITVDKEHLNQLKELFGGISVIRSVDVMGLAYEGRYLEPSLPRSRESMEAVLFALKYSGCSTTVDELKEYIARAR